MMLAVATSRISILRPDREFPSSDLRHVCVTAVHLIGESRGSGILQLWKVQWRLRPPPGPEGGSGDGIGPLFMPRSIMLDLPKSKQGPQRILLTKKKLFTFK